MEKLNSIRLTLLMIGECGIMGYQESFVQFANEDDLKQELQRYSLREKQHDIAEIVCVDRVRKTLFPFHIGELLAVVCGERSVQRSKEDLSAGLGLQNVKSIVFIDHYLELSNGDLDNFLNEHFERLSDDEYEELIKTK
ncbi:hypothetical protein EHV15_35730 [Paenibacillus oralis]|uniref:Uncharacterized protein n=1 Tax=Paenibacillus oralis TaxID=2490856 RepID=A0A3P3TBM1_9BACL|nr:hypothetical protein [Paenibacillus oralis]RRJ54924.1 hypothetical protein EHV15_35730 [Paenibacillus oralis]